MEPTIETTADGSATLRSPLCGETYHSLRGAVGEARHVFIEAGFLSTPPENFSSERGFGNAADEIRDEVYNDVHDGADFESKAAKAPLSRKILEMGFGTGLNAWLTLAEAERTGRRVEYVAVELHPVEESVAARLGYTDDARFMALHRAPWGVWAEPSEGFRLLKLHGDLAAADFFTTFGGNAHGDSTRPSPLRWMPSSEFFTTFNCASLVLGRMRLGNAQTSLALHSAFTTFDVVYWDAFAPDTQPELWTAELFARVHGVMRAGGVLVTYSAKGDVRRALAAAGFEVERLAGALGKRHMLRARKAVINC